MTKKLRPIVFFIVCLLLVAPLLLACGTGTQAPAKTETKPAEAPKAETKAAEAPKAPAPKAEAPKTEAPKAEAKPAEKPAAKTALKVGVVQQLSEAGVYVALEKGYFAQENLDIEIVVFDASQKMVPALSVNQIQVGTGGTNAGLLNAVARGVPLYITADKGYVTKGHGYSAIIVRKDLIESGAVKDFKDLKGKKVAVLAKESAITYVLWTALSKGGLTLDDVELVILPMPDSLAAMTNKAIDVTVVSEPLATTAVERGIGKDWKRLDEILPEAQMGFVYYSPQFSKDNNDAAKRFMVAYIKGVRDYMDAFDRNKNRAEIINILVKHAPGTKADLYDKMVLPGFNPDGYVNIPNMTKEAMWYFEQGFIKEKPDVEKLVDHQFVDYAIQKLGKYK